MYDANSITVIHAAVEHMLKDDGGAMVGRGVNRAATRRSLWRLSESTSFKTVT